MDQFYKVHRAIKLNQKTQLKPNIDINTELRKIAKHDFQKDFFQFKNKPVFRKAMENMKEEKRY